MNKVKILIDSMIFDELIKFSPRQITRLCEKCEFMVADVTLKELGRIKNQTKKEAILKFIEDRGVIKLPAGIFSFRRYRLENIDDPFVGFNRYENTCRKGRMLRYSDADIIKNVRCEVQKRKKGKTSASNDRAIALLLNKYPKVILVTEDVKFKEGLKRCGQKVISLSDLKNLGSDPEL